MRGMKSARASVLLIAGLVAGCAPMGGLTTGAMAPRVFDLSAGSNMAGGSHAVSARLQNLQIVVDEPTAVRSLDGDMILVAMSSAEITSLAKATWSDRLPRLVQARMIEALSAGQVFKSVGSGDSKASADIVISGELRAFQIEAIPGNDVARVAINVRLIDDRSAKVVASRLFNVSREVGEKTTDASVVALNDAFSDVLGQITDWSIATLDPKATRAKLRPIVPAPESGATRSKHPGLVSQYDPSKS